MRRVVYLARQTGLNRLVALKMILSGAHAAPEDRARFLTEAAAVALLQHPNIVQVYQVDEQEGRPWFALEYVEGGSLDQYLDGTPWPAAAAARFIQTLAEAIHYAHQRQIVHRDLKPANILLQRPEAGEQSQKSEVRSQRSEAGSALISEFWPKIADFGLAKLHLEGDEQRTRTGSILGTPCYMAPEQAAGKANAAGPATDVYALGAILYELLTGRPPFRAATAVETTQQVLWSEPVTPRRLQASVPRDLETICLKCLEKEPAKRYPSAAALAEDLRRFSAHEPIAARPISTVERLERWCRRKPALAGLSAALLLLAVSAFAAVTWLWLVAEEQYRLAQNQRRQAERISAGLALDKGQLVCEQGDVGRGLLWLARCLELAPADDLALTRAARTGLAAWSEQLSPLQAVFPHHDAVKAVAFSPDGRIVLTGAGGRDASARFWDAASGEPLGPPLPHDKGLTAVAFSPDGRTALTASSDGTVRLWEVASRRLLLSLAHPTHVRAAAFSPDGRAILTATHGPAGSGEARLWDAASGEPRGPPLPHPGSIKAAAFHPDGHSFMTGSADNSIRLWDAATGQPRSTRLSLPRPITAFAYHPDGRSVVIATLERAVCRYDAATLAPVGAPLLHDFGVVAAAFSPDGRILLTASVDGVTRFWDVATSQPLGLPLPHHDVAWSVAYHPEGQAILTGSQGHAARRWGMPRLQPASLVLRHDQPAYAVAVSPDGRTIVSSGGDDRSGSLRRWDAATGQAVAGPVATPGCLWSVAFHPDGRRVVAGGDERCAQVRDALTGAALGPSLRHDGCIFAVAFSPDGGTIVTASADQSARLWETATGKPLGPALPHEGEVRAAVFSPDGRSVLTATDKMSTQLWDVATCRPLGPPRRQRGPVLAAAFMPDGSGILSGGGDKVAQLWNVATGQPLGGPLTHRNVILAVAVSPDGRTLLTGSGDRSARFWDAATGKPLGPPLLHDDIVRGVTFSPDGRSALTASADGSVRRWDVPVPLDADRERILLWVQVSTGMELSGDGSIGVLDDAAWQDRRRRLAERGGPPG